jgi:hypothetical protein
MNIAWGGDMGLQYRRLPGRRPSRSLPREGMSVAIGATIRGYVSWNSPQDRSIECRVIKPCSVAIASGWPLPTNAGSQTAASCPLLSR